MVLGHNSYFKSVVFALTLLLSSSLNAAIVANSVRIGGASNTFLVTDNQWRVYGSFLGPTAGPANTDSTVDSCKGYPGTAMGANFVGCNKKRVKGSTILTVTFSEDQQFQGQRVVLAYLRSSSDSIIPVPIPTESQTPLTQGSQFQAQITWQALCQAAGGGIGDYSDASNAIGAASESCLNGSVPINSSFQFVVGVDSGNGLTVISEIVIELIISNPTPQVGLFTPPTLGGAVEGADGFVNVSPCERDDIIARSSGMSVSSGSAKGAYTGICDYQVAPGDDKIFMVSSRGITNTFSYYSGNNGVANLPYTGFILFLSRNNFGETLPWNAEKSITNLLNTPGNFDGGFKDNSISAGVIKNEIPIFTRLASLDRAGNITHLFSDAVIGANCGAVPAAGTPAFYRYFIGQIPLGSEDPPNTYTGRCPYATIPSLVTGLLSEDVNCFVATALKGSPYDYQVLALREFRNRFLKSFSLGRSFIDFYYEQGPKAAQWLNQNPKYKPFFRILLWPPYLVAKTFNHLGGFLGLGLLGLFFLLPFGIWRTQRSSKLYN